MNLRSLSLLLLLALPIGSCVTTVNGVPVKNSPEDDFPPVSAFVEAQLDQQIRDIPYLRGNQVVEACASAVRIGPGAIPKLRQAAADTESERRAFAMNVLGGIGDRRAIPILERSLHDDDPKVRYEAARSCVRLGDWRAMPVLIDGLADESPYSRALCHDVLRRETNLDFGFHPQGSANERAEALEKWRSWWAHQERVTLDLRS